VTLALFPSAAGPTAEPPFLSKHGNKAEIGHESVPAHPLRKRRDRCPHQCRVSWDVQEQCRLPAHHKGSCVPPALRRDRRRAAAPSDRPLRLPARRRSPSGEAPENEHRKRLERDRIKGVLIEAIATVLARHDAEAEAIVHGRRRVLERAAGKLAGCRLAQVIREVCCGAYFGIPFSCHVRGCPDCDATRQARFAEIGEALVCDAGGEGVCSFFVLTALNAAFGTLERALKRFRRDQARIRRTPPFLGGPCRWPGHDAGYNARGGHRGVPGGFSSDECPPSTRTPSWNLHTNWIADGAPFIEWAELVWWWRRITCPRHPQNCPGICPHFDRQTNTVCEGLCPATGSRPCAGGAWDVHVRKLQPGKVMEAVKYSTKPSDLVQAGPLPIAEFLIATRGAKLINRWGSFRGRELVVDAFAQAIADKDLVDVALSRHHSRKLHRICPLCKQQADYDTLSVLTVRRSELYLAGGYLTWRPPPKPS